jgi:hypothetical protein
MLIDSFAWIEYKNVKVLTGDPHFSKDDKTTIKEQSIPSRWFLYHAS